MFSDTPNKTEYLRAALRSSVYEVVIRSPMQLMEELSTRFENQILVKREDNQLVRSFKLRGAYSMITNLRTEQKKRGVITASAGNHAQGVAFSASRLNIKSTVVMPITTPDIKIAMVRRFGGEVFLYGNNFDEAKEYALALASKKQITFVPPFDHPMVIAGQGTIALELLQQDAYLDRIFIPVGGGGLASGVAVLIKQLMPQIKVIGVEARESACLQAALSVGKPVDLDKIGLFAEGVAVKRIGDETFRLCRKYLDEVISVENDEICSAIKDLFDDVRALAEPSGALALAGLKKYVQQYHICGERLVHILSGANFNFHGLRYVSERCELGEQREALLAVILPEKKGSFLHFCQLLGGRLVTELNYRYTNSQHASILVGIRLTQGRDERFSLLGLLRKNGYHVIDLSDDEMAKLHVRYMIGGRPDITLNEKVYSFEFREAPGELLRFLQTLGVSWNITLFHYRSHGANYGQVLAAFEYEQDDDNFISHLEKLGYVYHNETNNPSFQWFLNR